MKRSAPPPRNEAANKRQPLRSTKEEDADDDDVETMHFGSSTLFHKGPKIKIVAQESSASYRDRAAERRQAEESEGLNAAGTTRGLDLGLLELQRKGIKIVDVLEGDTASAGLKLAETKIKELFGNIDERRCMGWKVDLSFDTASAVDMKPVYDVAQDSSSASIEQASTKRALNDDDIKLVVNVVKHALFSLSKQQPKGKQTYQQSSDGDLDEEQTYSAEIQELSDDEQPQSGPIAVIGAAQIAKDVDDDDFDMFGGFVPPVDEVRQTVNEPDSKSTSNMSKSWQSLSVDELRLILTKVSEALVIQAWA